jgi:hypothetical protein
LDLGTLNTGTVRGIEHHHIFNTPAMHTPLQMLWVCVDLIRLIVADLTVGEPLITGRPVLMEHGSTFKHSTPAALFNTTRHQLDFGNPHDTPPNRKPLNPGQ